MADSAASGVSDRVPAIEEEMTIGGVGKTYAE